MSIAIEITITITTKLSHTAPLAIIGQRITMSEDT